MLEAVGEGAEDHFGGLVDELELTNYNNCINLFCRQLVVGFELDT